MENELELGDSTNLEELAIPETLDAEQQEALEAIKEQNKQLFERAKKAEALAKELKAKVVEPVQPRVEQPSVVTPTDLEKLNLRQDGYSKEEVDFIMRNGGANAVTDEFVTAGIKALRDQKAKATRSEEANPSISSKSPIMRKYNEDQLRDMPTEELEKIIRTLPSK